MVGTHLTQGNDWNRFADHGTHSKISKPFKLIGNAAIETTKVEEMKVSETREERAAAFRLVQKKYIDAGLTEQNPTQMRVMRHH